MGRVSDNTFGAFLMMASMLAFTLNDTCMKLIGTDLPFFQLLLLRGLMATGLLALMAWYLGAFRVRLRRRDWQLIALRSLAETVSAVFFLQALFHMPIANITALLQLLPLTVTLAGALVLGERVGWRRMGAIGVGFAGMLLIVRPGTEGFNIYTIYALIAVALVTVRDLAVRRLSPEVPSVLVTLVAAGSVTVLGGLGSLGQGWVAPGGAQWALMAVAAVFVLAGYGLSVMVMRVGELVVVTPFRYTGLLWALVLGWLVFDEWPVPLTLAGAAIIAATGLYTLMRERRLARPVTRAAPRV